MERLDASAQDLREAGQLLDSTDLDAVLAKQRLGTTSREQLDAQVGEPTGKVDHTSLIEHANQRAHVNPRPPAPRPALHNCVVGDCNLSRGRSRRTAIATVGFWSYTCWQTARISRSISR